MKKLIIVGAGGFGSVVAAWGKQIPQEKRDWEVFGFIDDNINARSADIKIIDTISDYQPKEDEVFICAIGESRIRLNVCRMLSERGAVFTNVIHPTAVIGDNCNIGNGVILCPFAVVSSNARVGNYVTVNIGAIVGHDVVAEDGCTIHGHCDVNGNVCLGEGVFMGSHSMIIPGIKVGRYAKIGAGSVVIKDIEENSSVFGNPAKKIG